MILLSHELRVDTRGLNKKTVEERIDIDSIYSDLYNLHYTTTNPLRSFEVKCFQTDHILPSTK